MVEALRLVLALSPEVQWVVVGDLRQEIYTFTGHAGDSLMSDPAGKLGRRSRPWTRCELNETYRMTPAIVSALNANYRGPTDPPLVAVRAAAPDDPAPEHRTVGVAQLPALVLGVLEHHPIERVAVLAPSVRSDVYGALTLAETLVEHGIKVYSTHSKDAAVTPEVLAGKLFISTYHQAKGREWEAVIVLGADSRLEQGSAMHAPLHVALTRARTRLVVAAAPRVALYPTTRPGLPGFTTVMAARRRPAIARPRTVGSQGWTKQFSLRWPIDFAADDVLRRAAAVLRVTAARERAPPAEGPASLVVTGGTAESVLHYYPSAVIARAAALLGERDPGHSAPLTQPGTRRARMVGPLLTEAQRALSADTTITAQQWVAVTSVGAAIRSGIRHPLKQLPQSFDWVDTGYIEREAAALAAALAAAGAAVFGQQFKRECALHRVVLDCPVPMVTSATLDGAQTPWRYSAAQAPTEFDLLLSAVAMWLTQSLTARIYCQGRVYTVQIASERERDELLELCFARKRA